MCLTQRITVRFVSTCLQILIIGVIASGEIHGQEFPLGATFDLEKNKASPALATLSRRDNANLPSKVDLSAYCPHPGDQYPHGTCTSWAAAYHARTMLEAIRLNRKGARANEAEAFSPSYIYNQIRNSHGCKNGTSLIDAMELMKTKGALKASVIKFNCGYSDWGKYSDICEPYKIKGYLRLHGPLSNNKVLPVKRALANKQPVAIGMHIVHSFMRIKSDGMFRPTASERNITFTESFFRNKKYKGHAMTVVGYDDSKGTAGAFRIINSWGTKKWTSDGFCWIEYKDFNRFASQSFSMIDYPVYAKDLKGMFLMETRNGQRMPGRYLANRKAYQLANKYDPGTQFRIYLKNDGPIYLYAFGFDATGKTFKLFPHTAGASAYIPYNKAHVPIPDDDHFIEIDNTPGRNDLCVIYAMKEIPVDRLMQAIEKQADTILQQNIPLRTIIGRELTKLGHPIVSEQQTTYTPDAFQFSTQRQAETCVPLILEFGR